MGRPMPTLVLITLLSCFSHSCNSIENALNVGLHVFAHCCPCVVRTFFPSGLRSTLPFLFFPLSDTSLPSNLLASFRHWTSVLCCPIWTHCQMKISLCFSHLQVFVSCINMSCFTWCIVPWAVPGMVLLLLPPQQQLAGQEMQSAREIKGKSVLAGILVIQVSNIQVYLLLTLSVTILWVKLLTDVVALGRR